MSACTASPAGSYAPNPGMSASYLCPAGYYTGASASSCSTCAAGTYAMSPGATSCASCAAGTLGGCRSLPGTVFGSPSLSWRVLALWLPLSSALLAFLSAI